MKKILALLGTMFSCFAIAGPESGEPPRIVGFDCAKDSTHMIEWLGLGSDYKSFVVADILQELHLQQPSANVTELICTSAPEMKTKALTRAAGDSEIVVSEFSVAFPVEIKVILNGSNWLLSVEQVYKMVNMEVPEARKLTQYFNINGSTQL